MIEEKWDCQSKWTTKMIERNRLKYVAVFMTI